MGWTVVGHSWIDMGSRGWINTGGIRGKVIAEAAATEVAAEVVAAVV